MAVDERRRHDLYRWAHDTMGPDRADTLMELLPPVGWADVATKDDLRSLGTQLRAEITLLGSDLRGEITVLGSDLRGDIHRVEARFESALRRQLLATLVTITALWSSSVGIALVVAGS